MNPREHMLRTIRGEPVDRVPAMFTSFTVPFRERVEGYRDPAMRDIMYRIYDDSAAFVGHDSKVNRWMVTPPRYIHEISAETVGDCERTTSEIHTPGGILTAITEINTISQTEWTIKYPVESLDDLEKLASVPWELPEELEPVDRSAFPDDFDERCILRGSVSSPFVCVAGAMSYQYFLQLCGEEPALLREMTEICAQRIDDVLAFMLPNGGFDYLWIGGCEWLTPPMGSPKLYDELVQGFEEHIIRQAHEHGAVVHVHCHGNVRSTIEKAIARGADFFEPMEPPPDGDITFAEAKALVAGRMTLGGNVEARIMQHGTPTEVERAVRDAFEGGKERMVFRTSDGPITLMTPEMIRNYDIMFDLLDELSPIE
jgi:uroporphyrinogen-III decarboxylase